MCSVVHNDRSLQIIIHPIQRYRQYTKCCVKKCITLSTNIVEHSTVILYSETFVINNEPSDQYDNNYD